MSDTDQYILDVTLSGEVIVRATNAISDPDKHAHPYTRRLSIDVSGSIDTDLHPWAKTFEKIDVTLHFSDEIPFDDGCAFLSASKVYHESNVVRRDSLAIKAFLPTASFTMVSQILASSRTGQPKLYLLTEDDIAAWAAQDGPELLKAQECAFNYDTLAAIDEQVREEVAEQTEVGTAPRRWKHRRKLIVGAPLSRFDKVVALLAVLFAVVLLAGLVNIIVEISLG